VLRSRRLCRKRPGKPTRYRFTAAFTEGVALSQQFAGAFSATDALFVGYLGATFGVMRRIPGTVAIHRLTITVGAFGVEELTLTLDGVAFVFSTAGALSTTALAEFIAEQTETVLTGWSAFAPQSVGATVTFVQGVPGVAAGAFTLASDGAAVGTLAEIQPGLANVATEASGAFVPRASWNIDKLDGRRGDLNRSNIELDPAILNEFEILAHTPAGPITYSILGPDGTFVPFHRINVASATENVKNPSLRIGWIAASLGSTTDLEVLGCDAAAFSEGASEPRRDPFSQSVTVTGSATQYVALALRVRGEFGGVINQREMIPMELEAGVESSSRLMVVRIYLNPTMTGTVNWTRINATTSAVDYAKPTTVAPTSGTLLATFPAGGSNSSTKDMRKMGVRLEPGDVLAVSVQSVSSQTAAALVDIGWHES